MSMRTRETNDAQSGNNICLSLSLSQSQTQLQSQIFERSFRFPVSCATVVPKDEHCEKSQLFVAGFEFISIFTASDPFNMFLLSDMCEEH